MGERGTHGRRRPRGAARLALVPVLALGLGGCINEEREQAIGDQIAMQVNAQLPLVRDVPVNLYVNQLGRLIARHSGRPDVTYHFYVVDDPSLNAFALPGGHVYVNRGLVERTSDVSELAGVLAHEIGHVAARHGAESLQRHLRTRSMARVMYQLILGREPLLDRQALDLGGALWQARHSRADEVEADQLAVQYLVDAGVDPRGMLALFSALWREEQAAQADAPAISWFSTHPGTAQRMAVTRAQIREVLPDARDDLARDIVSYGDFLRRLQRLPRPMMGTALPQGHPPVHAD